MCKREDRLTRALHVHCDQQGAQNAARHRDHYGNMPAPNLPAECLGKRARQPMPRTKMAGIASRTVNLRVAGAHQRLEVCLQLRLRGPALNASKVGGGTLEKRENMPRILQIRHVGEAVPDAPEFALEFLPVGALAINEGFEVCDHERENPNDE